MLSAKQTTKININSNPHTHNQECDVRSEVLITRQIKHKGVVRGNVQDRTEGEGKEQINLFLSLSVSILHLLSYASNSAPLAVALLKKGTARLPFGATIN